MSSTETPASNQPKAKFYKKSRFYIVVGLVAVVLTPTLVYFAMSFNSANGTVVQLVTGHRSYQPVPPSKTTINLEVHVWSSATSIDTRVQSPSFTLGVDSFDLGNVPGTDGTFSPYGYIVYFLTFETNNSAVAVAIGQVGSNRLVLSMNARVTTGWYSGEVTRTASATWTWTN